MRLTIYGSAVQGLSAVSIPLEVNEGPEGSPAGPLRQSVKESRQRIEAAITNTGFTLPPGPLPIPIGPADAPMAAPACDLPLALAMLAANEQIAFPEAAQYVVAGALAPDGTVLPVNGALPMAINARTEKFTGLIVPEENAREAATVNDLKVYGVSHLRDAIAFFKAPSAQQPVFVDTRHEFFQSRYNFARDFGEIKGQENSKRALEIAAAGGHHVLMIGPPGTGQSRLPERLPTILPPLTLRQALETTEIHSVAGKLADRATLLSHRPFRSPHHTTSAAALTGDGPGSRPGEFSLAHNGVLFMGELPEFTTAAREALRQAMGTGQVWLSGTKGAVAFPAAFLLVAAMNPCPCGYFNHPEKTCTCTPDAVRTYLKTVAPLVDCIDLQVDLSPATPGALTADRAAESSESIRGRVLEARERQAARFRDQQEGYGNARLEGALLERCCQLDQPSSNLLQVAMKRLQLPATAYDRIRKISRTIADLQGEESIKAEHIAEAIQYRVLDRENKGA